MFTAHRLAYSLVNDCPIPVGMLVRHSCDDRRCVEPSHLSLGTHQDNSDDKLSRRRQAFGERHGSAKLTQGEVSVIRDRLAAGETCGSIAACYGVNKSTIVRIRAGNLWALAA